MDTTVLRNCHGLWERIYIYIYHPLSLSTNYKVVAWGKLSSLTFVCGLIRFDLKMSTSSSLPHYLNYTPMSGTLQGSMMSYIKLWKHITEYITMLNWIYVCVCACVRVRTRACVYIYIYMYMRNIQSVKLLGHKN